MGAPFLAHSPGFFRFLVKFLSVGAFIGLILLFGMRSEERPAPKVTAESPLSCEEVGHLGEWGWSLHGGPQSPALASRGFFEEVVERFAERLDPLRLWILSQEVSDFTDKNYSAWLGVLDGNCAALESALLVWYRSGQEQLELYLASRPATFLPERDLPDPVEPPAYPANQEQSKERLDALADYHLTVATEALRDAFRHDASAFLKSTLNQIALPENVDPREWLAKAILGGLDHYSTYFSAAEYEEFEKDLRGEVSGIGVRVRQVPSGYLVEAVLEGTPAEEMGVRAGEIVLAIDGIGLAELNPRQAGKLFSGPPSSKISLKLESGGQMRVLHLVRRPFNLEGGKIEGRIETGKRGSKVGIIEIPSFYGGGFAQSSAEDLREMIEDMLDKQVDSMVLDLRGNPGGYLDEAVTMASFFLGGEPIVAVVSRDNERVLRNPGRPLYEGPLVVLVDEESASASEVLAGALKDHQRALLVGAERTFGKGSVQKLFHLNDEMLVRATEGLPSSGVVKLTTSLFYSPLGHSPSNGGVETHVKLSKAHAAKGKSKKEWEERPFLDSSTVNSLHELRPRWAHLASRLEEKEVTTEQVKAIWTPFWQPDALQKLESSAERGLKQAVAIASEIPKATEWKEVREKAPWGKRFNFWTRAE